MKNKITTFALLSTLMFSGCKVEDSDRIPRIAPLNSLGPVTFTEAIDVCRSVDANISFRIPNITEIVNATESGIIMNFPVWVRDGDKYGLYSQELNIFENYTSVDQKGAVMCIEDVAIES